MVRSLNFVNRPNKRGEIFRGGGMKQSGRAIGFQLDKHTSFVELHASPLGRGRFCCTLICTINTSPLFVSTHNDPEMRKFCRLEFSISSPWG